jgi:hypothetical protein
MTDTANLALPCIEGSQAQKHVTHNDALRILDTLVQLAVLDRDLTAPPGSPTEGQRWIVKAGATGAWAGHVNAIAAWQDGVWQFSAPRLGWIAFVADEATLVVWNGSAWGDFFATVTSLQNLALLGIGAIADAGNPLSVKLNNTLWTAKTVAEGGDGNLRYKLSKESAAKSLSLLMQNNFSGRAEIGLTGDDDLHFKTSPDGSAWIEALLLDKTSGSTKINSGFYLTGDISPTQITADQNDYNPGGLAGASVLRLSTDARRNLTGLAGGGDGRIVTVVNAGANPLGLKNASASSSASNRFDIGSDLVLNAKQACVLLYDATDTRWKLIAGRKYPAGLFYANRNGTNQTGMTASATSKVAHNNEVADANGWYDAATNYRYQPLEPGYYFAFHAINVPAATSGETPVAQIARNGTVDAGGFYMGSGGPTAGSVTQQVFKLFSMNGSSDYLEANAYLPAGITSVNGTSQFTFWGGFKVGDL